MPPADKRKRLVRRAVQSDNEEVQEVEFEVEAKAAFTWENPIWGSKEAEEKAQEKEAKKKEEEKKQKDKKDKKDKRKQKYAFDQDEFRSFNLVISENDLVHLLASPSHDLSPQPCRTS
jgi:hypothetical protein